MPNSLPQKKGHIVGTTKCCKGTKIMAIAYASGLPVEIDIKGASAHQVKLGEATMESRFVGQPPMRSIGYKAYDSEPLD